MAQQWAILWHEGATVMRFPYDWESQCSTTGQARSSESRMRMEI
jgi:hypothetical protein